MDKVLHSSSRHDHQTPEYLLDLVRKVGPILYDPCTAPDNPTRALMFSTPEQTTDAQGHEHDDVDGLAYIWPAWERAGVTYINPPYGRALGPWTRKIARHDGETIVCVPARVETRWFKRLHAWCTWRLDWSSPTYGSRLKFTLPDGEKQDTAPFPSTIFYHGPQAGRFLHVFSPHGTIVPGKHTLEQLLRLAST